MSDEPEQRPTKNGNNVPASLSTALTQVTAQSVGVPAGHKAKVEAEEHADDRAHRQKVELIRLWVGIFATAIMAIVALVVTLMSEDPTDKRWAQSVLSAIIGGAVVAAFKK